MKILVINAGSSSLKYQLIDTETHQPIAKGQCERVGIPNSQLKHSGSKEVVVQQDMDNHEAAIKMVLSALTDRDHGVIGSMEEIGAVGHRVVHGGEYFSGSALITDQVIKAIEECIDLAPLHNPPNLTGILACAAAMPKKPQVAVFDTAFHQTMPPESYMYALPFEFYSKYKIRKYGFHGTSHKYVSGRAAKLLGRPIEQLKIITLHLGNGSSICAVKGGKSIDTSMGFTPLEGLPMGTRCGSIDPAIVTFLMEKEGLGYKEINNLLNKNSGVLGVSQISSDFRDISGAADQGNDKAELALKMFEYSACRYIGSYAAIMGGLDALVFTAGIGENTGSIRNIITQNLGFLGVELDPQKNTVRGEEADISADDARVRTLVIPTNEELMIAMDAEKIIGEMN